MRQKLTRQEQIDSKSFPNLREEVEHISHVASAFEYTQDTPAEIWTITHNLNKYPKTTIIDSVGDVVYAKVTHITNNQVTVKFSEPVSGKVLFQ